MECMRQGRLQREKIGLRWNVEGEEEWSFFFRESSLTVWVRRKMLER